MIQSTDEDGEPSKRDPHLGLWHYYHNVMVKVPYLVLLVLILVMATCSINAQAAHATPGPAYNIEVTDTYVSSCATCSCGAGSWYQHQTAVFVNRCPMCGHRDCLYFEEGPADSNMSPEGMWACRCCDADFCCQCGSEHSSPPRAYLTPYKIPLTEKVSINPLKPLNITI